MPSVVSPQWQEKASGFFQSSGVKLKEAGQSAGSFVGEVAKDAKGNVGEVAEKVGSVVKSRWSLLQQPSTRHAMQERFISAAATTSFFLRKGFLETKDKVAVGKTKVEEVTSSFFLRKGHLETKDKFAAGKTKVEEVTSNFFLRKGFLETKDKVTGGKTKVEEVTSSFFLRKGYLETKDKVAAGKTKVEEVAKKTAQKSKTLLTDIERWQKGVASTDVFGVPINILVQRQQSTRSVPYIMVKCADYLVLSGLNSPELFKAEGDKKVIHQLVSLYNQDQNASIPEGVNPVDIAALMKCYLASLPEPLTTFELYNEIRGARSSIHTMKNTLKKIPTVNYMTLELITALLLRVSQKSLVNKMDPRTLATEMAPILIWQRGQGPHQFDQFWNHSARTSSKKYMDSNYDSSAWEMLEDEDENVDASSPIPLDDGLPIDLGAIDAIQCLIEHHNAIFTDANETVWR